MHRREFIAGLRTAVAWPLKSLLAQQRVFPTIGWLDFAPRESARDSVPAFHKGLAETGYVEGRNLDLYVRWANEDFARLPGLASELVSLAPHVIVSAGTSTTLAFQRATSSIPIVMSASSDPIIGKIACKTRRQHHGAVQSKSRLNC